MSSSRYTIHQFTILLALIALCTHPRSAAAQADCPVPDETITIIGPTATICIPVNSKALTTIFPGSVSQILQQVENDSDFILNQQPDKYKDRIFVGAKPGANHGAQHWLKMVRSGNWDINIVLQVVADDVQVSRVHRFEYVSADEHRARRDMQELRAAHKQTIQRVHTENQIDRKSRSNALKAAELILPAPSSKLTPIATDKAQVQRQPLSIRFADADWNGAFFLVSFKLEVPSGRPYRLAEARVTRIDGSPLPSEVSYPSPYEQSQSGLIAEVTSRKAVDLVIAVNLDGGESPTDLVLHLSEPEGDRLVTAEIPRYGRLRPIGPKEEARIQAEEARQRRGKQMLVSVQGFYGAYFMRDGVGQGETEVTTLSGLGVRVTQGFIPEFALEAELVVGATGSARWDDIAIDDVTGELTREAWLGRAMVSAVGRMGDTINPYLRIGLGTQLAGHDAQFSAGANPDSSTEFTAFINFGGGVDARLGESLVLGAALHFDSGLG
ncbi:MAG: hypothetical protein AAGC55_13375, partial [Myxococcota bacterium]